MTITEAKERISAEFMTRYYEWLKDLKEMPERDFGKKYGYGKGRNEIQDNLKAVTLFQKYFFSGKNLPDWVQSGYERQVIWELHHDGFLSYLYDSRWIARQTGTSDFYYISQAIAKQIYKQSKGC